MRTGRLLPAVYLGLALILGLLWPLSHWGVSVAQAHPEPLDTAAIAASAIPPAQAGTGIVRVALAGADVAGCGGIAAPCATIQFAVDEALAGEEIRIAGGTYSGVTLRDGTNQHVYISKTLTLRGGYAITDWLVSDPVANPTILDAESGGRVILAKAPLTVENLSLINGNFNNSGGGLFADFDLTMTIVNVLSNTATSFQGGGVGVGTGQVTITWGKI
jgi:hypothetical protein